MKRILSFAAILGMAFMFMSAITILDVPQDPPKTKKVKKHIKMIKIEDGEKVKLDTLIEGDNVFIWNGDTIDVGKELKWISKNDFELDSFHQNFDMDLNFEMEENDEGKVVIIEQGKDGNRIIKDFKIDGDHDVMMWNSDEGEMIFDAPEFDKFVHPLHASKALFFSNNRNENVIDLADPGVISYKKKNIKGGREKITVIREKRNNEDVDIRKEIIIDGNNNASMFWHGDKPQKAKTIKVIASDDGKVEVIEDGKVFHVKKGDENIRVIPI